MAFTFPLMSLTPFKLLIGKFPNVPAATDCAFAVMVINCFCIEKAVAKALVVVIL